MIETVKMFQTCVGSNKLVWLVTLHLKDGTSIHAILTKDAEHFKFGGT